MPSCCFLQGYFAILDVLLLQVSSLSQQCNDLFLGHVLSVGPAENSLCHPHRRNKDMNRMGKKRRLISFDQVPKPSESKCGGDEKQSNDPVKPNHDDGRKSHRNSDQMQCPIPRMIVRAVIMRVESHQPPRFGRELYLRGL